MSKRATSRAPDACQIRLHSQWLTSAYAGTAAALVGALGAVQSQDYAGAKWALGQRLVAATDASIEAEFAAGAILRTHVLRPTWHFVAPADIRWMLELTGSRVGAVMARYNRELGLTPAVLTRAAKVMTRALQGGAYLTRAELKAVLARARINAEGTQRLARIVMQAELDGVICSGPRRGNQFTYALLDERASAPSRAPRDRDAALRELAARYFATRGPATAHDFSWWSGLTVADARRAIELNGSDLEAWPGNDGGYWNPGRQARPLRRKPSAHLLPNYDEYFIGHRDRSAIGRRLGGLELVSGGNALIGHVAFLDGQLVGAWKGAVEDDALVVALQLLTPVTAAERARLAGEVRRMGRFAGVPARMTEVRRAVR